jgi:hypothetical protein
VEQVNGADCGAGERRSLWSRWTEQTVEQVDGADCGAGGRSSLWSRWKEQIVEQVDGADCGVGGRSRLWTRWTEQTVEQVDGAEWNHCYSWTRTRLAASFSITLSTNIQDDTCRERTTSESN